MVPRETENNAYAKFWGDKHRALWYVMVFSGVANSASSNSAIFKFCRWKIGGLDIFRAHPLSGHIQNPEQRYGRVGWVVSGSGEEDQNLIALQGDSD